MTDPDGARTYAILGPTAVGKSRLALQIARARHGSARPIELVAIDAFTVYRGMDLATAKPTAAERREVAHHLVDVLDPSEELSVAQFQSMARAAIEDVRRRGADPLLVGGSGLYWRATVDDLRFPPTDAGVRAELEGRWGDDHLGAHAELAVRDPVAAEHVAPENLRRTIRALEVITLTGKRFSSFRDAWDRYESLLPGLHVAYLEPPTECLRHRIHARAERMVADGLLEEARQLRVTTRCSRSAAQAIGYAEAFAVLDGHADRIGLVEAIATRTWRYAKRQRSWFRADPRCEPVDPDPVRARWSRPG